MTVWLWETPRIDHSQKDEKDDNINKQITAKEINVVDKLCFEPPLLFRSAVNILVNSMAVKINLK